MHRGSFFHFLFFHCFSFFSLFQFPLFILTRLFFQLSLVLPCFTPSRASFSVIQSEAFLHASFSPRPFTPRLLFSLLLAHPELYKKRKCSRRLCSVISRSSSITRSSWITLLMSVDAPDVSAGTMIYLDSFPIKCNVTLPSLIRICLV